MGRSEHQPHDNERNNEQEEPLPFRKTLITATATAAGVVTGYFSGVAEGMGIAFTVLTALDEFIPLHKRSRKK